MITFKNNLKRKVSTDFAIITIGLVASFLAFLCWRFEINTINEAYAVANNLSFRKKVSKILSSPGRDTSGRKLAIDRIPVEKYINESSGSEERGLFRLAKISRYRLFTPEGVESVFYVKQKQEDKKYKSVEVEVPEGKNIVGVRMIIEKSEKSSYLPINSNLMLESSGKKIFPFNNPNVFNFPAGSSVEYEYLFYMDNNIDSFILYYGENLKKPEGQIEVDFSEKIK